MSSGVTTASMAQREHLANLFRQNWAAMHPDDSPAITVSSMSLSPTVIGIRHVSRMRNGGAGTGSGIRPSTGIVAIATQPAVAHQPSSQSIASAPSPVVSVDQNIDDSLTSLTWLQNLNVMKLSASAANAASSPYGAAGHARGAATVGSILSGSGYQYQHQATRPTGAVQPIQINQLRRSSSTTSGTSASSAQRLGVDPNDVLDMSHLTSVTSCRSVKTEHEASSLQTCGSPMTGGATACGGASGNCSPSLPPRLSPQPMTPNADIGSSCGGQEGRPSPSPPALQAAFGNGNGAMAATKPSHSYATLICMAMNDATDNRVTLAGIYGWIIENFPYYRTADPSWQNSIRHNLSLNKCFQRVQRDRSDPPGKGSYWTFNPDFQQIVDRDLFRKRGTSACSAGSHNQPATKRPCRRSSNADEHRSQQHRRTGGHVRQLNRLVEHELELVDCQLVTAGSETAYDDEGDGAETDFATSADFGDGSFNLADALDMSWSAILGRDIDEPSHHDDQLQQQQQPQNLQQGRTTDSMPPTPGGRALGLAHRSPSSGSAGSSRDSDDDVLDELIRACADVDSEIMTPTGVTTSVTDAMGVNVGVGVKEDRSVVYEGGDDNLGFDGPHVDDPLDLTVYGIGLRPPDWWNTLDIGEDLDGFSAVPAAVCSDARRSLQQQQQHQLQQQIEEPHPWAENRDRGDGRRPSGHGVIAEDAGDHMSHRLFDSGSLASSFDGSDHLLLMTSSGETPSFDVHDHLDEF